MASIPAMQRNIVRGLLSADTPPPIGCTTIKVAPGHISAQRRRITVFLYADQALTDKIFSVELGQYPLPMLLNHTLVLSAATDYTRRGQVKPEVSELMTGALAGLPVLPDLWDGAWGTSVDADAAIWHVPRADLVKYDRLKTAEMPTEHLLGSNWLSALLVRDWPSLPEFPASGNTPTLQVVHVPNVPTRDMSVEQWRKVATLTCGYNNVEAGEASNPGFLDNSIDVLVDTLVCAENPNEV